MNIFNNQHEPKWKPPYSLRSHKIPPVHVKQLHKLSRNWLSNFETNQVCNKRNKGCINNDNKLNESLYQEDNIKLILPKILHLQSQQRSNAFRWPRKKIIKPDTVDTTERTNIDDITNQDINASKVNRRISKKNSSLPEIREFRSRNQSLRSTSRASIHGKR